MKKVEGILFVAVVSFLNEQSRCGCFTTPDGMRSLIPSLSRSEKNNFGNSYRSIADRSPLEASSNQDSTRDGNSEAQIDISLDPRFYRVRLPRATGIEWGTDLSFSFVYVRDMDPAGPASLSNMVSIGDQICELKPLGETSRKPIPLIGSSFDEVMTQFASLNKMTTDVDLVFFRGTKDELTSLCEGGSGDDEMEEDKVKITVIQNKNSQNGKVKVIIADKGANVRNTLVEEGINVYQSVTRWTNCKGKQLCGTCIVNVPEGAENTNRKSMDEESTLRENPGSYRLSCVTFVYGNVTVETFPPLKATQWTR